MRNATNTRLIKRAIGAGVAGAVLTFALPSLANERGVSQKRYDISIGGHVEYINLRQPTANVPQEPLDKGFLYGFKISGSLEPFDTIPVVFLGNFKYSWSANVKYTGTDEMTMGEETVQSVLRDVPSQYRLLDLDIAVGYRIGAAGSVKITPYGGYKLWRWNNLLSPPDSDSVHETSPMHGLLFGVRYDKDWNTKHASYFNGAVIIPLRATINFIDPTYPRERLGRKMSFHVAFGHTIRPWFAELRYAHYRTGEGLASTALPSENIAAGEQVKSPVNIHLLTLSTGIRF